MTREETAWLAGLCEGEASFLAEKRKRVAPYLRIKVVMTDEDVVQHVAKLWGAKVYEYKTERLYKDGFKRKPVIYSVRVDGDKARTMMKIIRPWMGERRGAKIDELLAMKGLSHHPKAN